MRYFIYADNRQQGPFSVSELMERGLSSETLVWAEGMEQWTPAWQVRELKDAMEGKAQPGPVPPPLPFEPSHVQRALQVRLTADATTAQAHPAARHIRPGRAESASRRAWPMLPKR